LHDHPATHEVGDANPDNLSFTQFAEEVSHRRIIGISAGFSVATLQCRKEVGSNYGVIPLFLSGSTDLSRTASLTRIFLDVCFAALAANRESFLMLHSRGPGNCYSHRRRKMWRACCFLIEQHRVVGGECRLVWVSVSGRAGHWTRLSMLMRAF
jgi:hypothetical protein